MVVAVAAPSGTGKTTFLEGVLAELKPQGVRMAVLKHHGHRQYRGDNTDLASASDAAKDTGKLRAAGAEASLLVTDSSIIWSAPQGQPPAVAMLIDTFFSDMDLVLVEGFRSAHLPTIVLERPEVADPDWHQPSNVIARFHPDQFEEAIDLLVNLLHAV